MTKQTVELSDVIYNAATQAFEARVTVHVASGTRSYACAIDAPITMTFSDAASGLAKQALRRDRTRRGLGARVVAPAVAAQRMARRALDPFAMLKRLAA